MCGIAGFTGSPDPQVLRAMCGSLTHRGPDDAGWFEAPGLSMAMRRLAIVDPASGRQPMHNEDRTVSVVFNGEIYNHAALRQELMAAGHRFRSHHSDTEVLVHLYEEHGLDFVKRLWGMFGLAIWDANHKRLVLARDRLGKKPLYYARAKGELVFGSEIKALFQHPGVDRAVDPASLYNYLGLKNTRAPGTAYAGISQLLPGHLLCLDARGLRIQPYWQADFTPLTDITEQEAATEIRGLIEDAVRLRMDCDAPYGAYLSGGVDSTTVTALMSRMQDRPVQTFCLGYTDEATGQFKGKAQDLHYAREMSRRLGTEHHEYLISAQDFARSMHDVLQAFDEPFSGAVSTFFLSILMHKHVKVALSGDGSDELFASYLTHRLAFPMARLLELRSRGKTLETLSQAERQSLAPFDSPDQAAFLDRIAHQSQAVWRDHISVFSREERLDLLAPEFLALVDETRRTDGNEILEQAATAQDPLNKVLEIDQRELLPNQILPFVDRLSMAHSIEVRCPFLDHRLVEFVNRLPGRFKIQGRVNKAILKRAVKDLLPQEIIDRPKEGFVQPIYSWMHGPLRQWTLDLLDTLDQAVFQPGAVADLRQRFLAGDGQINAKVWNLCCFSLWWQGSALTL